MYEPLNQFEGRKRDHIELALKEENEACGLSGFDSVELIHEALPELNFSEVKIDTKILGQNLNAPFLISSMTAGHADSVNLNVLLARAAAKQGWLMGVGSQRRELFDGEARNEWQRVRAAVPNVRLLGNLGLTQIIETPADKIRELVEALEAVAMIVHLNPLQECLQVEALEAVAMIVHLNPLQECLQVEGTPNFKGGLSRLTRLVKELSVPVIVKETGCGFSKSTLAKLSETGVQVVDVSGFGGTHWGRIEGGRSDQSTPQHLAARHFSNWGVSTVESLVSAQELELKFQVWASGGVRSGVDAAKAFALGASVVGFAKPILQAALHGEEALLLRMKSYEYELKTALFCTGAKDIADFQNKKVWKWRQKI